MANVTINLDAFVESVLREWGEGGGVPIACIQKLMLLFNEDDPVSPNKDILSAAVQMVAPGNVVRVSAAAGRGEEGTARPSIFLVKCSAPGSAAGGTEYRRSRGKVQTSFVSSGYAYVVLIKGLGMCSCLEYSNRVLAGGVHRPAAREVEAYETCVSFAARRGEADKPLAEHPSYCRHLLAAKIAAAMGAGNGYEDRVEATEGVVRLLLACRPVSS